LTPSRRRPRPPGCTSCRRSTRCAGCGRSRSIRANRG
jgi:hypothetical protein